ncbi:MAG: Holliday junction resolvase RuvX [Anaerolineales bacterium]|nr:Holliday junction resolvase RuvX [Anaerolineales bacterium]
MSELSRILAVDPGDKRLGIAISDPTRNIASPVCVLDHVSREKDAQAILSLAEENNSGLIVIGQALNWEGEVSPQGRKSTRLADMIRSQSNIPVVLWNEYGSTSTARNGLRLMKVSRKKRADPLDDLAATVILQTYLDANTDQPRLEDS